MMKWGYDESVREGKEAKVSRYCGWVRMDKARKEVMVVFGKERWRLLGCKGS